MLAALVYPRAFPLDIPGPFFPESDSPDPYAPLIRNLLYLTAILIDVLVYSLLTYVVLSWRERRKLKPSAFAAEASRIVSMKIRLALPPFGAKRVLYTSAVSTATPFSCLVIAE